MKFLVRFLSFIKHANVDILLYAAALYFVLCNFSHDLETYILLVIVAICLILWVTAHMQLGDAFSVIPNAKQLVTTGLYRYIRNPIYVFSFIANVAILLLLRMPILYVLIPAMFGLQLYRAHRESQVLEKKFGQAYKDYAHKTWF